MYILNIAVGVTVKSELTSHTCRKRLICLGIFFAELTNHPFTLSFRLNGTKFISFGSKKVIEF